MKGEIVNIYNVNTTIHNECFWLKNPADLFINFYCIFPLRNMSIGAKYNSLTRLLIIVCLVVWLCDIKEWIYILTVGILLIAMLYFNAEINEEDKCNAPFLELDEKVKREYYDNGEEGTTNQTDIRKIVVFDENGITPISYILENDESNLRASSFEPVSGKQGDDPMNWIQGGDDQFKNNPVMNATNRYDDFYTNFEPQLTDTTFVPQTEMLPSDAQSIIGHSDGMWAARANFMNSFTENRNKEQEMYVREKRHYLANPYSFGKVF
jgi:hypothetical protein